MDLTAATDILKNYWGYPSFRAGQDKIIEAATGGKDILALLPTGGGKSVCYQVPGMLLEGLTLVISPLIALMDDQVRQLNDRGIKAYRIHSGFSKREIEIILDNCINGLVKFLYLSPERLMTSRFLQRLPYLPVSQLAVDEAHCISQWGHDFRPAYLQINKIREQFPDIPIRAFTATATKMVREDISRLLDLQSPYIHLGEVFRPNLALSVRQTEDRLGDIYQYCVEHSRECGIVYVRNRRACMEISDALRKRGVKAGAYHAGLPLEIRQENMDLWLAGKIDVMVATNAFGMGIDKSNVRYVLHVEAPPDLESYYQEAGRAGRDGEYSEAILFAQTGDLRKLKEKWEEQFIEETKLQSIYKALALKYSVAEGDLPEEYFEFDYQDLAVTLNTRVKDIYYAIRLLQIGGWIEWSDSEVRRRSTVEVLMSPVEFRNTDWRWPWAEDLIMWLLRMYEGILSMPVNVNEQRLATHMNINLQLIRERLKILSDAEIIDYKGASGLPTFRFIVPRVRSTRIEYKNSKIDWIRDWQIQKLKHVGQYLSSENCLYQMISAYFGLPDAGKCGICSVCRSANSTKESGSVREAILNMLKKQSVNSSLLVQNLGPGFNEQQVLKELDLLLSEEIIYLTRDQYSLKP